MTIETGLILAVLALATVQTGLALGLNYALAHLRTLKRDLALLATVLDKQATVLAEISGKLNADPDTRDAIRDRLQAMDLRIDGAEAASATAEKMARSAKGTVAKLAQTLTGGKEAGGVDSNNGHTDIPEVTPRRRLRY